MVFPGAQPARRAFPVARRQVLKPAAPTSDVRLYPAPVEAMFAAMAAMEYDWMSAGCASATGSSVFVAGRKPTA